MVDITLTGKVSCEEMQKHSRSEDFPRFEVTSVDPKYRGVGIIEGWLSVQKRCPGARLQGVRAVFLALKPHLNTRRKDRARRGGD